MYKKTVFQGSWINIYRFINSSAIQQLLVVGRIPQWEKKELFSWGWKYIFTEYCLSYISKVYFMKQLVKTPIHFDVLFYWILLSIFIILFQNLQTIFFFQFSGFTFLITLCVSSLVALNFLLCWCFSEFSSSSIISLSSLLKISIGICNFESQIFSS